MALNFKSWFYFQLFSLNLAVISLYYVPFSSKLWIWSGFAWQHSSAIEGKSFIFFFVPSSFFLNVTHVNSITVKGLFSGVAFVCCIVKCEHHSSQWMSSCWNGKKENSHIFYICEYHKLMCMHVCKLWTPYEPVMCTIHHR